MRDRTQNQDLTARHKREVDERQARDAMHERQQRQVEPKAADLKAEKSARQRCEVVAAERSREHEGSQEHERWQRERQRDERSLQSRWSELREPAEAELKQQFRNVATKADEAMTAVRQAFALLAERQDREKTQLDAAQARQRQEARSTGQGRERELAEGQEAERRQLQVKEESERKSLSEVQRDIKACYEKALLDIVEARDEARQRDGALAPEAIGRLKAHAEALEEEAKRAHETRPDAGARHDVRKEQEHSQSQEEERDTVRERQQEGSQEYERWKRERQLDERSLQSRWSELREPAEAELKQEFRNVAKVADEAMAVVREASALLAERQDRERAGQDADQARQRESATSHGQGKERELRKGQDAGRGHLEVKQKSLSDVQRDIKARYESALRDVVEARDEARQRDGVLESGAIRKLQAHALALEEETQRVRELVPDADARHNVRQEHEQAKSVKESHATILSREQEGSQEHERWRHERQLDENSLQQRWSELREAAETELKEAFRGLARMADEAMEAVQEASSLLAERQECERSEMDAAQVRQREVAKSQGPERERDIRKEQDAERERLQASQDAERERLSEIEHAIEACHESARLDVADARDESRRRDGALDPEALRKLQAHVEALEEETRRAHQMLSDADMRHDLRKEEEQTRSQEDQQGAARSREQEGSQEQERWTRERQLDDNSLSPKGLELRERVEAELERAVQNIDRKADEAMEAVREASSALAERQERERSEMDAAQARQREEANSQGPERERQVREGQDVERERLQARQDAERRRLSEIQEAIEACRENARQDVVDARNRSRSQDVAVDVEVRRKLQGHAEALAASHLDAIREQSLIRLKESAEQDQANARKEPYHLLYDIDHWQPASVKPELSNKACNLGFLAADENRWVKRAQEFSELPPLRQSPLSLKEALNESEAVARAAVTAILGSLWFSEVAELNELWQEASKNETRSYSSARRAFMAAIAESQSEAAVTVREALSRAQLQLVRDRSGALRLRLSDRLLDKKRSVTPS